MWASIENREQPDASEPSDDTLVSQPYLYLASLRSFSEWALERSLNVDLFFHGSFIAPLIKRRYLNFLRI